MKPWNFWDRVKVGFEDECWPWQGAITSRGYGHLHHNGKTVGAHRMAYRLRHGQRRRMK